MDYCIRNNRAVFALFAFILILGLQVYFKIPKESFPDVSLPLALINAELHGASAEYMDRSVLQPIVHEVSGISSVREVSSYALDGRGSIVIEFASDVAISEALRNTRDKINNIRSTLPSEVQKIRVDEINFSLFPVLTVILRSDMPYRQLAAIAESVKDEVQNIHGVLEARIIGRSDEIIDVLIKPEIMQGYDINITQVIAAMQRFNAFQAVGNIQQRQGQYAITVDNKISDVSNIMSIPLKKTGQGVVYVRDIVEVRKSYRTPNTLARVDGGSALAIEISKKVGIDVMQVTNAIKQLVAEKQSSFPENIKVIYSQDSSEAVRDSIRNLENSIIFSMIIVMAIIAIFSNMSAAVLIALTIPGSFFIGILGINLLGYSINMMVLFGLMLSVGILVDSALVVVEYADRLIYMQYDIRAAFREAAVKMFMPVLASTLTTQVVFLPLLFWPGVAGQFLRYLPITVLLVMSGSLVMSLYFIPTLGSSLKKLWSKADAGYIRETIAIEELRVEHFDRLTKRYHAMLLNVLKNPHRVVRNLVLFSCGTFLAFALFGKGVEFFPEMDPENVAIMVKARGNLSFVERTEIVNSAEQKLMNSLKEVKVLYTRLGQNHSDGSIEKDIIGQIFLELIPWEKRRKADHIIKDAMAALGDIPGVKFEAVKQLAGPPKVNDIQILLTSDAGIEKLKIAENRVRSAMQEIGGFLEIKNNLSAGVMKFLVDVDNDLAALLEMDRQSVSQAVSLVAGGLFLGKYSGMNDREDMDMLLHYDQANQNMGALQEMRLTNAQGVAVAMQEFTKLKAISAHNIERVNSKLALRVNANVAKGLLVNNQILELRKKLNHDWDPSVKMEFKGETKDMQETMSFLKMAFIIAICGIVLILLLTFNSFMKALLIMTAVLFSIVGVLLSILMAHSAFGIVMCGIGIITLAGIAVNNNILLIDMYDHYLNLGYECKEAVIRAAVSRLRPILLTSATTALGLLPMVLKINLDILHGNIGYDSPPSQFWAQLSTSIAGGMIFSTVITLFFTPAVLLIIDSRARKIEL